MNLRLQAAADLVSIVGGDFGWPITITTPDGLTASVVGFSTDISESIDPQTGMLLSERKASVALSFASLIAVGITGVPTGVASASKKPWVIRFNDILGTAHTFAVKASSPDIALGIVTCQLEIFRG
jgi:ABC-type dipeptide/oligopeptide/nickel transport system permease component